MRKYTTTAAIALLLCGGTLMGVRCAMKGEFNVPSVTVAADWTDLCVLTVQGDVVNIGPGDAGDRNHVVFQISNLSEDTDLADFAIFYKLTSDSAWHALVGDEEDGGQPWVVGGNVLAMSEAPDALGYGENAAAAVNFHSAYQIKFAAKAEQAEGPFYPALRPPVLGAPVGIPISDITTLQKIGNDAAYPLDGTYYLTQDIDASATSGWNGGAGFLPIGGTYYVDGHPPVGFQGTFDGRGHKITGLTIDVPEDPEVPTNSYFVGLVGVNNGSIVNLGIEDADISGDATHSAVGALAGATQSSLLVDGCYSTGTVTGYIAGGMFGLVYAPASGSALVSNCWSSATVSGVGAGGFAFSIGQAENTVLNCYSLGGVTGSTNENGFAHFGTGPTVTSCYWDTETSGQATSDCGTGKNTVEMQTEETFVDWDFDDVWTMTSEATVNVSMSGVLFWAKDEGYVQSLGG